jgi:hypothetical protein
VVGTCETTTTEVFVDVGFGVTGTWFTCVFFGIAIGCVFSGVIGSGSVSLTAVEVVTTPNSIVARNSTTVESDAN